MGEITVFGRRDSGGSLFWSGGGNEGSGLEPYPTLGPAVDGGGGGEAADEDAMEIVINVANMTAEQKAAVQAFQDAIGKADTAIRNLADNAGIRLYDGSIVTGKELKALWAKTDFVINPDSVTYPGDQNRGFANYNGGDPIISLGITTLSNYNTYGVAA